MARRSTIRLRIFLRQCRWAFALIAVWFALGTLAFYEDHVPLGDAVLDAFYFRYRPGPLWILYSFWGQCVLFGIVVSLFLLQALQHYNPQEGCRMLAREMKNHAVVIGYTHFGKRLVEHLRQNNQPYVLIEKNALAVEELVRAGEPVLIENAKDDRALDEAGVARARLVVIASNNLETALIVTRRARERNKKARVIVRCFLDEFCEILESLGANEVISSSKSAFREIAGHLDADAS
jgi:glutamyl-tRNA reductase